MSLVRNIMFTTTLACSMASCARRPWLGPEVEEIISRSKNPDAVHKILEKDRDQYAGRETQELLIHNYNERIRNMSEDHLKQAEWLADHAPPSALQNYLWTYYICDNRGGLPEFTEFVQVLIKHAPVEQMSTMLDTYNRIIENQEDHALFKKEVYAILDGKDKEQVSQALKALGSVARATFDGFGLKAYFNEFTKLRERLANEKAWGDILVYFNQFGKSRLDDTETVIKSAYRIARMNASNELKVSVGACLGLISYQIPTIQGEKLLELQDRIERTVLLVWKDDPTGLDQFYQVFARNIKDNTDIVFEAFSFAEEIHKRETKEKKRDALFALSNIMYYVKDLEEVRTIRTWYVDQRVPLANVKGSRLEQAYATYSLGEYAEQFQSISGVEHFARFTPQNLRDFAQNLLGPRNDAPAAFVIFASDDWNGAFYHTIEVVTHMAKGRRLFLFETKTRSDVLNAFYLASYHAGTFDTLAFFAHGSKYSMGLSPNPQDGTIDIKTMYALGEYRHLFKPHPTIFFASCSTGGASDSIAAHASYAFDGVAIAPYMDTSPSYALFNPFVQTDWEYAPGYPYRLRVEYNYDGCVLADCREPNIFLNGHLWEGRY